MGHYKRHSSSLEYNFSVVIVDDGSTDGSSEWITEWYPEINIIKGDGNLWWSGSVNKGAKFSVEHLKADFVILWNDDTVCDVNYFKELTLLLSSGSKFRNSILASKVYWIDEAQKGETLFNYGCYYSFKTGKKKLIGVNEKDLGQFNEVIPIDWSGGMGTVIPSKVLISVDYFDSKNFPQYHGDLDFFLRAGKAGFKSYAVPTLKIYNNRDSTGTSKANTMRELKNMLLSNRSHYNIYHNMILNKRHANNLLSWFYFMSRYLVLISRSINKIALS